MHGCGRKRGKAHCNVLGAHGIRRAVANPLAWPCDYGLPGDYVALTTLILEMNPSSQNNGDLHELRALTGFDPTRG